MIRWLLPFLSLLVWAQQPSYNSDPRQTLIEAGKEERSLLSELELLDRKLAQLQIERLNLQEQQETLEQRREKHLKTLHEAERTLRKRKRELRKSLQTLYVLHRRGIARVIFGADSPTGLRRRSVYLMSLIQQDTSRLDKFKEASQEKKKAVSALDDDVKELADLGAELQIKEAELSDQKTKKHSFLSNVRSKRETALQLISEVTRSRASLKEQLQSRSSYPAKSTSPQNFRDRYGLLPWPIKGKVIRKFGKQADPFTGSTVNSYGIDIQASIGTPIKAVADGIVALAQFIPAYGQTVALEHGQYSTVYAHLNGIRVRQGQSIKQGEVIGLVGNTGLTDSADKHQLTFEIRYNRSPQDPLPWLRRR
jgi:septal ring factor EnvC (AmiA/AmiB activator)